MRNITLILLITTIFNLKSQTVFDWGCLPQSPDYQVNDFTNYNSKLIAVGNFSNVGVLKANRIASWDGTAWDTLSIGLRGNGNVFGYTSLVYNNELYVVGRFDSAGLVPAKNIAKWNGNTWSGLATSCNGVVYSACMYNSELYIGGTFTNINGVSARHIAKWNGSNWTSVGTGIYGNNVINLYEYQNQLFALGAIDSAGGKTCRGIARWNGSVWDSVSNISSSGNIGMIEWQGKLLIGSQYFVNYTVSTGPQAETKVQAWDGVNWTIFSHQQLATVQKFFIFNNELYFAGGDINNLPSSQSNVFKFNSSTSLWEQVGTGINNYAATLFEYNGELLCGGYFHSSQGGRCDYIGKLVDVTTIKKNVRQDIGIKIFPNPAQDKLNIQVENETQNIELSIQNILGQNILEYIAPNKQIDISNLPKGIYFIIFRDRSFSKTIKFIKD